MSLMLAVVFAFTKRGILYREGNNNTSLFFN